MDIETLKAKLVEIHNSADAIRKAAEAQDRPLTEDEKTSINAKLAQFNALEADIQAREALDRAAASLSATPAPKAGRTTVTGGTIVAATHSNHGFKNAGDFFAAVRQAKVSGQVDPRLIQNITTYANEGANADGAYAIPPDFRAGVMSMLEAPDSLVSRVDSLTTFSNSVTLPMDEETPWAATGINVASVGEGVAITQTKPVLKTLNIGLTKYGGLISVTEEMMEDGTNIGAFVTKKAADKLQYVLNAAVLTAVTGAGSKIAVAKQAAEAVGAVPGLATIQKMWVTCLPQFRKNAVWLVNPILETAMQNWVIGQMPVYVPAGGLSGAPFSTLFGRPVIFIEGLAAQGVTGSVILADLSSIYGVFKTQGVRADVTPYFAFDQDMLSYRVLVRAGFKSKLSAAVTRPDATTASNVVVHATF